MSIVSDASHNPTKWGPKISCDGVRGKRWKRQTTRRYLLAEASFGGHLANALSAANRTEDALALERQNIELFESRYGPDHPATLSIQNNLATTLVVCRGFGDPVEGCSA